MTEEIINTDDYFYEITDEGRGTIGYGCVSYKTAELVRRIHKQNKQLKRLEQENKELKEMLSKEPKAMQAFQISYSGLKRDNETLWGMVKDYKTALEEIRAMINHPDHRGLLNKIEDRINEVLK